MTHTVPAVANPNTVPPVNGGTAEVAALKARIAELEAQAAAKTKPRVTLKVAKQGGISIFGLQRFPVTLYASQWVRVFALQADVMAFIEANRAELAFPKGE